MYHNGNVLTGGEGHYRWEQGATSSVVELEAGDQVNVRCLDVGGRKCHINTGRYTSFTGILVRLILDG